MINSIRLYSRYLLFSALLVLSQSVHGHEIRPSIVDLNYVSESGNNELVAELVINLESLMAEVDPANHDDTKESENSAVYEEMRKLDPAALENLFSEFSKTFLSNINLTDKSSQPLKLQIHKISIPVVGDISAARDTRITLISHFTEDATAARWQWNRQFGEIIVRGNSDVQQMDFAVLLAPGQTSELIQFTTESTRGSFSVFANYVVVGFEHILPKGLDHILFVIGLFLLTPRWRALLAQVTTFTVAHSITLALGAADIIRISPSVVEPIIALSIVFVCVENIFSKSLNKWRLAMVFGFGLLHGLGFASVLGEFGLDTSHFFVALLGFNVGVEFGQLTVILACALLIGVWFGKKLWYHRYVSTPLSIVVGAVGLFWFVERTLL